MNTPARQNNFNLVRLLLALLVLLSHAPELIDGNRSQEILTRMFGTLSFGELAVDGFFLLSGYLIMQSWDAQPQAWPFLKKRMLRIYPGFVIATLVCAFAVGPLAAEPET
jgi:peptidoglycan/LPS O-acetylase OafA/YrhL